MKIKTGLVHIFLSVFLAVIFPVTVWADTSSDGSGTDSSETTPAPGPDTSSTENTDSSTADTAVGQQSVAGPQAPTGADANTYVYNPSSGLWENAYYTWDPITHQTTPKSPQDYSYNPATGMWDTTQWVYDAPSGTYVPNVKSIQAAPAAAQANNITNTGPNSQNNINNSSNNSGTFNNFYNAAISNRLTQTALTGNAAVLSNTVGGSALSGNAVDISNIINVLQSTWNIQPATDLLLFTSNINGDVTGDLLLDPSQISNTGPLSSSSINSKNQNNLTVNSQGNGLIDNTITLDSTSGNATVSNNTTGGNATSGNADAVANIVNIINSAITTGQSFLGVININGNLNGDILLPPNFLDQLISSSAPRATVNLSQTQNNNLVANLDSTQNINNSVDLNAHTGTATVDSNTNAGAATTGAAATNLTIFNLTGRQVVGANSLMVFVNVLGSWVGLIVDAPTGSNTAAFCGGVCQINSNTDNNATINDTAVNTINNNLRINSTSGDAAVTNNTNGGGATSGNATASANLMNINNSQLSLSGWFGLLFINVLGNWHGSFGVNTDAGTISNTVGGVGGGAIPGALQVFKFIPDPSGSDQFTIKPFVGSTGSGNSGGSSSQTATLAQKYHPTSIATGKNTAAKKGGLPTWLPVVIGAAVTMAIFSLGAATELYDKLWAARISRISSKKPARTFSVRSWLSGLSWKLPLF